jgi:hypothetical protein
VLQHADASTPQDCPAGNGVRCSANTCSGTTPRARTLNAASGAEDVGMPDYRRNRVPGGTYFLTTNLRDRRSDLLVVEIAALRDAVRT